MAALEESMQFIGRGLLLLDDIIDGHNEWLDKLSGELRVLETEIKSIEGRSDNTDAVLAAFKKNLNQGYAIFKSVEGKLGK